MLKHKKNQAQDVVGYMKIEILCLVVSLFYWILTIKLHD